MKFTVMILCVVLSTFGLVVIGQAAPPFSQHTQWGEMKTLGNGEIQTFATVSPSGKPKNVGVYFSAELLENLPTETSDGRWDVLDRDGNVAFHCCGHEVVLDFPQGVPNNPFQHFVLNWNPDGHNPPGVYDLPHFDFHFYLISNEERTAILAPPSFEDACWVSNTPDASVCGLGPIPGCHPVPLTCDLYSKAVQALPEEQSPPGYLSVGAVEPAMGNHLLNPTSPELQGEVFTKTWIYGAFSGNVIFFEPMITKAVFDEAKKRISVTFPTPDVFSEPGWYPTQYSIYYLKNKKAYVVALERMAYFE